MPMAMVVGLVTQLELKQTQLGLSHGAMARELEVSRNYWYRLRKGNRDPGWSLLKRVQDKWQGEFDHLIAALPQQRQAGGRRGSAA
jgi:predicted transcriptional regulator